MANKDSDLVIGFITNYNFDKLKPWVYSLIDSEFSGQKAMVCYNIQKDVIEELEKLNFIVFPLEVKEQFNIVNIRFLHIWQLLKNIQNKPRYVITTDVADVIFQSNPSEWLEKNLGDKKICVGGEGLKYKDEEWGINNMYQSFGPIAANYMQDTPIYNAGTIAGEYETLLDFCYNVSLLCNGAPQHVPGGGGPDQAALNLLLSLKPYKDIALLNDHDTNWSCQCGTTVDPTKINKFRPNLLSPEPVWKDGKMYNSKGEKYVLLHQYNRVPELKKFIQEKYDQEKSEELFIYRTQ
jgi:hypothetical protein